MDFVVAADIKLAHFKVGDAVEFTFKVTDEFIITKIAVSSVQPINDLDDHSSHGVGGISHD